MTNPYERTRALLETKSFLLKLTDPTRQPRVPKSVREHAEYLLQHYPAYVDIEAAHKALPALYASAYPPGLLDDPQAVGAIEAANARNATAAGTAGGGSRCTAIKRGA